MVDFFRKLFEADFLPHGHCFFWSPGILWLHVASDALTAASYFVIPLALIRIIRRRKDLVFDWMVALFGLFILFCGLTHVLSIWVLWNPVYRFEGVLKLATALASVPTAALLVWLVPRAVAIPSASMLREEIALRRSVEDELRAVNAGLEETVTERTRALEEANRRLEAALRNSAEREREARTLVEALPQLAWSTRPDGAPDYFNERWYAYTGVAHGATDGDAWTSVLHPGDRDRAAARWARSVESGESYEIEYRLRRFDGIYRWFLGRGTPLVGPGGLVTRWFGTCTDIDDQRRDREALEEANRDLESFTYAASHDLQEPLRTVLLYGELIQQRYSAGLDEKVRQGVDSMVAGAKRLSALLQDLRGFLRSGLRPVEPAEQDVNSIVEEVLENLRTAREEADASIVVDPLPPVRADKAHLVQLFQNLISNALKYRSGAGAHVHVGSIASADGAIYWVRDRGVGIEAEYAERIFAPFQRLHSQRFAGSGLGLAICRRVVSRYGGRIWVESRLGEGSTFYFTLHADR
ncbi:MAG: ATP-binding protein [Bryobacteraceae bacterium]|nr:ATP-binding protein [Bryobacteraceae bacterium]